MYSILYVDDEELLLTSNKLLLEKNGEFSVDTVQSAEIALEQIATTGYDAVLSDYQMPGMDGIEFLKQVRSRFGNLPFVLFTGKGREEIVIDALNNGADFYIQKGPDIKGMIAELKHKIRRAIERKRFAERIVESEQQLADIIDFLPDATCAIDIHGRVIAWNRAMENLTGIPKSGMVGKGDYAYAVPFYGERRAVLMDLVLRRDPEAEAHYDHLEKTGGKINSEVFIPQVFGGKGAYVWATASPLYDRSGNVIGAIESIRDVTELYLIRRELDTAREMNLGFANILPVGVYEMDRDCKLTFANDRAYELFGLFREDPGQEICILDYITPVDRRRAAGDIRDAMADPKKNGQEYLLQRKDGSTFPSLIYGAPVIDSRSKNVTGLRGVIIDLTQRKREAQALRESEERLKLAVKAGDLGIWDVDMRTMTVYEIHEWALRTLGYDPGLKPVTIYSCKTMVHPLDLPRLLFAFFRHLKGKIPLFEGEFRMRHNDGIWIWVMARGKIIERNSSGEPVRITGTINAVSRPRSHGKENCS